jgi:hypothetical protein
MVQFGVNSEHRSVSVLSGTLERGAELFAQNVPFIVSRHHKLRNPAMKAGFLMFGVTTRFLSELKLPEHASITLRF